MNKIEEKMSKADQIKRQRQQLLEQRQIMKKQIEKQKRDMMEKIEKLKQGKIDPNELLKSFTKQSPHTITIHNSEKMKTLNSNEQSRVDQSKGKNLALK